MRRFRAMFAALAAFAVPAAWCEPRIDVNPAFPSFREEVLVQLTDAGQLPYIPATRYRVNGKSIVVEIEHNSGGYFGIARTDIGIVPLSLGELAPGTYAVQARLYDIFHADAAPWIFTRSLEVAPPDVQGVYTVPRAPGAYDPIDVVVKADGPIDASTLRASVDGRTIRVDFDYSSRNVPDFASVRIAGIAPGTYRTEVYGRNASVAQVLRKYAVDVNVGYATTVVEYYSDQLDHYVITAWPDEIAMLDADARASFKRTGERFKAWLHASDAPGYAVAVCRFYAAGPNSHFYTADPGECGYLKSLEAKQRAEATAKGQVFLGWQFEAIAFYALAPQSGTCPAGSVPVYRSYNDRAAQNDSNHRFTVRGEMRAAMRMGWLDEGLAFCSPA